MNAKVERDGGTTPTDKLKYAISVLIVVAGIAGFYWFSEWPAPLRGAGLFGALVVAAVISAFTSGGRAFGEYLSESRFELRKVVWPTRPETLRSTGVIIVVVIVISLLLALIDFILANSVRALLG